MRKWFLPFARNAPPPEEFKELSVESGNVSLGPLKFVPRDGGLFSNLNFLVGDIYFGRKCYPVFSADEFRRRSLTPKHFPYFDEAVDNSWFSFFEPIRYSPGDRRHRDTGAVSALQESNGEYAQPEFRVPGATMALYARGDFPDWRKSVHDVIAPKIVPAKALQRKIAEMLARMPGRRIGVHIRHPSHSVEQGAVFFSSYYEKIDALLRRHRRASIFLATDNDLAVAALKQRYGNKLFYYPDFIRSTIDEIFAWIYALERSRSDEMGFIDGVGFQTHYKLAAAGGGEDGIRAGKEAVLDVFTLAACDDFVCTASNFTLTCAYMNPKQALHLMSRGTGH